MHIPGQEALHRLIRTAKNIIGTHLSSISDIVEVRCLHIAKILLKEKHLSPLVAFSAGITKYTFTLIKR